MNARRPVSRRGRAQIICLRRLYDLGLQGPWRSLYRETDPLGDPVLSWGHDVDPRWFARPSPSFLPADLLRAAERWGPDFRLRDPITLDVTPRAVRPHVDGHRDYYADPAFELLLEEVAVEAGAAPWSSVASPT